MSSDAAAPLAVLVAIVVGYLLGSVPFGLLLTQAAGIGDIRQIGSGNIGATNVLRTGRRGLALATLLLDGAKGAAAVVIGLVAADQVGVFAGGLAAVLGHMYPVWLRFRGGKGVATGFGVLIAANPFLGAAAGVVWLAVAFASRFSSAGALAAFAAAPLLAAMLQVPLAVITLAFCVAMPIWFRHAENIHRLLNGTEPRIGEKR